MLVGLFVLKQERAYELRTMYGSKDVCSSDLKEPLSLSKGRLEGLRRRCPSRRGFDKLSPSSGRTEIKKRNYMKLDSTVSAVVTGGASGLGAATEIGRAHV